VFPQEQGALHAGVQWLAYAANGTFKGQPIYCNYGSAEDFAQLAKLGVSLTGKIALIRYGAIYRFSNFLI
jgi:N-acetylated-alpha-linked acidic dipeptidase